MICRSSALPPRTKASLLHACRRATHGSSFIRSFPRKQRTSSHKNISWRVTRTCRRTGVERLYPEPMYGIADVARGDPAAAVLAKSPYLWDRRKARDRLLGSLRPLFGISKEAHYVKRPGLTLGIVSFIVPIKQFPLLFSCIAPSL